MAHTLRNQNAKLDLDMNSNPARSHSASPEPPPLKKGKSEVMEIKTGLLDQGFDPYKMPCRDVHKIYERIDSIDQGVYGSVCFLVRKYN